MQTLHDLKNHPDATRITFAGQEWDFFICPYGMMKADDAGIDVLGEFDTLFKNQNKPIRALATLSKIVWVGLLPFHPNLTVDQVQINLTLGDVGALTPVLTEQMQRLTKGGAVTGEAQAPTKGRKK